MSSQNNRFNPYRYFERNGISKTHVIIFVALTAILVTIGSLFSIHDFINHPQFSEAIVKKKWFQDNTEGTIHSILFTLFFIVDFVWAAVLLSILGKYVYSKAKTEEKILWFFWVFLGLATLAFGFDTIENSMYLYKKKYPSGFAMMKIISYGLTLLIVLGVWLKYSLRNKFVILRDFLSSATISLVILFIIGLTLPKAPQINSIVVDLYYKPVQFVVFILLVFAPFYCIVLSHYPNYFLLSKSNRKLADKKWKMSKRFWLFGTVWYCNAGTKKDVPENFKNYEHDISFLRRTLGVFFYAALFYMLAYTADTNFTEGMKFSGLSVALLAGLIALLYVLKLKKDKWRKENSNIIALIDDPDAVADTYLMEDYKPSLAKPIAFYLYLFIATVIAHIVLYIVLVSSDCPYNFTTVSISLLCVTLQAITYVYYRTFRSLFKYAFFNDKVPAIYHAFSSINNPKDDISIEEKKKKIRAFFKTYDFTNGNKLIQFFAKIRISRLSIGALSNNVVFLQTIIYLGVLNIIFLTVINSLPEVALKVNAIVIILSYFFLFYGIIVVILKHFIYYNLSEDTFAKEYKRRFFFTISLAVLILLVLNVLARFNDSTSSNLYKLTKIERSKSDAKQEIALKDYVVNLENTRYYIGCYGGGMKANAWTMTVLNALNKNNTLYDKTVCLSGASGGTIGLTNYSVIQHEIPKKDDQEKAIRKIGTANILSMDITHLLGRDLLNHVFVPKFVRDLRGKDRSTGAMRRYADFANPNFSEKSFNTTSYRKYWKEMYQRRNQRFPILITNTTNIKGKQGMAVSVRTEVGSLAHDVLYIGAEDILALDSLGMPKTLSFYNAVSTTNRFPLISPAATIFGKGQYNDGGIYENSGLISAYKLYEAINELDASAITQNNVFINIVNDKSHYIKHCVDKVMKSCRGKKLNESNEVSAIVNSVAATEMLPGYIKDKLRYLERKGRITFESIYLPHKFSFDDVKAIYGPDFKNIDCVDDIKALIEENHEEIKRLMQSCSAETNTIIEPEMSRVMAIPAFDFMQYMLDHKEIKGTIEKLQ